MKAKAIKIKLYQFKNILGKLNLNLRKMLIDLKTQGKGKIQLSIALNFLTSKDTNTTLTMHSEHDKKNKL